MPATRFRALRIAAIALLVLVVALLLAAAVAAHRLQSLLEHSLGPLAKVGAVQAGLTSVEIRDVVIAARPGSGWPAEEEVRAARVVVTPDLRSLWPGQPWRLHGITVDGGHLVMLRGRDGRLKLLPSLLPGGAGVPVAGDAGTAPAATTLVIGEVVLRDCSVDYFDASVATPPHRIRLAGVRATAGPWALPALDRMIMIDAQARLVGPQHEGRIDMVGNLSVPLRDGKLQAQVKSVDLAALQPYVAHSGDAHIRRGTLDLEMVATLDRGKLTAPGRVTLRELEIGDGGSALGTISGVPRQAVLAAMSRDGRIELRFTLAGRLDDPKFSLNENIAARFATGLAESLGVSVGQAVKGVGGILKGLLGR